MFAIETSRNGPGRGRPKTYTITVAHPTVPAKSTRGRRNETGDVFNDWVKKGRKQRDATECKRLASKFFKSKLAKVEHRPDQLRKLYKRIRTIIDRHNSKKSS